jgi:methylmalonyl-CoA mutase N-terminal domain/subunit
MSRPAAPARAFETISGRPIDELYTPERTASLDYARDLGDPGQFPYTRGIHASGYRGKLWTMRQFAGFGTPGRPTHATGNCSRPAARASAWPSTCRR